MIYEDLIKRMRELQAIAEHCDEQSCDECENRKLCNKYDNKTLSETYKEAVDAIEELQAQLMYSNDKIPKWSSVTECLPPAEKEVYVTDGEYIARANLLDEVFPGDKPCWSYSGLGEITHWCEQIQLPKPPKEWADLIANPITKGDQIQAMTDEELANWYFSKFFPNAPYCNKLECYRKCLLNWLKQKAEEGET